MCLSFQFLHLLLKLNFIDARTLGFGVILVQKKADRKFHLIFIFRKEHQKSIRNPLEIHQNQNIIKVI